MRKENAAFLSYFPRIRLPVLIVTVVYFNPTHSFQLHDSVPM
jgi:hypothetical protein